MAKCVVSPARSVLLPMQPPVSRRKFLTASGAALLSAGPGRCSDAASRRPGEPFRYSLNTATIRGQRLPIAEEIEIAARAGYQAIEPWIDELERYKASGGSLRDLAKRLRDRG